MIPASFRCTNRISTIAILASLMIIAIFGKIEFVASSLATKHHADGLQTNSPSSTLNSNFQISVADRYETAWNDFIPFSTLENNNSSPIVNGTRDSFLDEWVWPIVQSLYFNSFMSGLFAGVIAILVTVIIEKFGPQIGGVIGTLPTTIVPAAIGFVIEANKRNLEWEEKKHVLVQQFFVIPWALFCNGLFLLVWKVFPDLFEKLKSLLWKDKKITTESIESIEKMKETPTKESLETTHELSVQDETSFESTVVDNDELPVPSEMKEVEDDLSRESTKENLLQPSEVIHSSGMSQDNSHHDVANGVAEASETVVQAEVQIQPHSRRYVILKMCLVIFLSLLVWFVLASVFVIITRTVTLSDEVLIGLGCSFYVLLLIISIPFNWTITIPKNPIPPKKAAWWMILSRGIFAFIIIAISVILSGLKLTIISGLLTAFPAIFLTAMVTLWLTQGEQASVRAASAMMLGSTSIPVFAISACVALLYMNMFVAIAVAYVASVAFGSVPAYAFLWWRKRVAVKKNLLASPQKL
ncbi:hypothetical protein C9374_000748 [Naegleria lovaniensis]|uniref:Uncharacterized protein n=1 Tax=Naegleria lovaniensis TaxID=51637 RepID=A0AA88GYD0_NAELO|nr:uncharacterized protein C9374_000748 [Naegleria lovaniensis]KAG2387898.1 hypothetical protein C9374_000748 [Naegleria lovaniensis]